MVLSENSISPAGLRGLLRKLRDADLHKSHVAIAGSRRVSIEGCLSLDFPIEQALRYGLRWSDGSKAVLWLAAEAGELELWLSDPMGKMLGDRISIPLTCDEDGRATAHEMRARIDLESAGVRELDHFLRRLVRGMFSAASN